MPAEPVKVTQKDEALFERIMDLLAANPALNLTGAKWRDDMDGADELRRMVIQPIVDETRAELPGEVGERARELLAAEYTPYGFYVTDDDSFRGDRDRAALRAITRALASGAGEGELLAAIEPILRTAYVCGYIDRLGGKGWHDNRDRLLNDLKAALATLPAGTDAGRGEIIEECAKVAETCPHVLHFWDRPGGPPGNGYRPANATEIAAAIRALKTASQDGA